MNRIIFLQAFFSVASLIGSSIPCHAQGGFRNLVSGGESRCDHVIQMILRHGVNNSFDRSNTSSLLGRSSVVTGVLPSCAGIPLPVAEVGDLQVAQVEQLPSESSPSGPKFAVLISNKSNRQICNFRVTAVAVFGQIYPWSPHATVEVANMMAGETQQVVVAMPIEVYSMGNRNGQALGFEQLVVAIDSYDQLLETDEANNIRAFKFDEIIVSVPVANPAISSLIESSGSPSMNPNQPQNQEFSQSNGLAQNQSQNQGSYVSVDALDLEQPTPESLRSAIKQVTAPAPTQTQSQAPTQTPIQGQTSGEPLALSQFKS